MSEALDVLEDVAKKTGGFVELRFHDKVSRSIAVERGKVERTQFRQRSGVGVRVLEDGSWGFASTGTADRQSIERAIATARAAARAGAAAHGKKHGLASARLARGSFDLPGI